jgi:hypothetical protein
MTAEEYDVLGAMAGWDKCRFCHHRVEKWYYKGDPELYETWRHPICWLHALLGDPGGLMMPDDVVRIQEFLVGEIMGTP